MSNFHQRHGRAEADASKGELRKPGDRSNQPGQGPVAAPPGPRPGPDSAHPVAEDAAPVGTSQREYGHSSGDRNTRRNEADAPGFSGGIQRDDTPQAPADPAEKP